MLELVREHYFMAFILIVVALDTIATVVKCRQTKLVVCNCKCNKQHEKEQVTK
jgi:hypothetical protein